MAKPPVKVLKPCPFCTAKPEPIVVEGATVMHQGLPAMRHPYLTKAPSMKGECLISGFKIIGKDQWARWNKRVEWTNEVLAKNTDGVKRE